MSLLSHAQVIFGLIKEETVRIPRVAADQAQLNRVVSAVLMIAGAICVLFIIVGALRYVTSQGDPKATQVGREMIIYSIVGLVVILMAFAIVQMILLLVNS